MNAPQAKFFQILLFKLRMDARWDNLSLRNILSPLIGHPHPENENFWTPPKIQNFQIPTPPLTLGGCAHYVRLTQKILCL